MKTLTDFADGPPETGKSPGALPESCKSNAGFPGSTVVFPQKNMPDNWKKRKSVVYYPVCCITF